MGLTVRATAELLGVAPSTVQDWRTGVSRSTGQPIELPRMLALACGALAAGVGPGCARTSRPSGRRAAAARKEIGDDAA